MRLYFKPGACSLASRIVLLEIGLPFEAVRVDTEAGRTESQGDYSVINPRGYVPALEMDEGGILTENLAILQFLADMAPDAALAPAPGSFERARLQEALSFISSELHKAFSPFFHEPAPAGESLSAANALLSRRIGDVERMLADGRPYLLGNAFSVADAYLVVVLNWAGVIGLRLAPWPGVEAYVRRLKARPAVRAAFVQEGLARAAA